MKKAFTLVELVIVVGILAILALIGIAYFRGQISKGNDAKRKADINRIKVAVEEYEKDHNCYPLPQLVSCNPGTGLRPYIDQVPCDPTTKASYFYDYENTSCPSWYRFFTNLENKNDPQVMPGIGPLSSFNFVQYSANAPQVTSSGTQPPPSGNLVGNSGFYGCINGVCTQIAWDPSRPGPACDPNYQSSNCYGQCGQPATNCVPWK